MKIVPPPQMQAAFFVYNSLVNTVVTTPSTYAYNAFKLPPMQWDISFHLVRPFLCPSCCLSRSSIALGWSYLSHPGLSCWLQASHDGCTPSMLSLDCRQVSPFQRKNGMVYRAGKSIIQMLLQGHQMTVCNLHLPSYYFITQH